MSKLGSPMDGMGASADASKAMAESTQSRVLEVELGETKALVWEWD
jgi:hypothetical protein